jgi:flagella synthesis protein FlgN
MTQTALSQTTLQDHIKQDIHACTQLLQLLDEEREALKSRDLDKLETIIQNKAANLQHLEQSAHQRTNWVAQQGKTDAKPETLWVALIRNIQPGIEQDWDEFKQLLQQCQEQNEINGKLLARNQQVFSRLLSIVRGQDEQASVYTPKGSRETGYQAHKLGEA